MSLDAETLRKINAARNTHSEAGALSSEERARREESNREYRERQDRANAAVLSILLKYITERATQAAAAGKTGCKAISLRTESCEFKKYRGFFSSLVSSCIIEDPAFRTVKFSSPDGGSSGLSGVRNQNNKELKEALEEHFSVRENGSHPITHFCYECDVVLKLLYNRLAASGLNPEIERAFSAPNWCSEWTIRIKW